MESSLTALRAQDGVPRAAKTFEKQEQTHRRMIREPFRRSPDLVLPAEIEKKSSGRVGCA
jgi:hypothetical protein